MPIDLRGKLNDSYATQCLLNMRRKPQHDDKKSYFIFIEPLIVNDKIIAKIKWGKCLLFKLKYFSFSFQECIRRIHLLGYSELKRSMWSSVLGWISWPEL